MSEKRIYTLNNLPKGKTDWERVRKMTEREINRAARSDPDNPPSTKKELAKFKRVHPPSEVNVKAIRQKMDLSQSEFAAFFGISVRTLQEWEQGRRRPEGAARTLLVVIHHEPKAVQRALFHSHKSSSA